MKEQNIVEEDWDNLIILDACRYDSFENLYRDYLPDGKLEKRRSRGSSTLDWLKNNFTGKYDITYISANPHINSYGIPLSKLNKNCSYSWKATEHFSKIIDVWNLGWDERLRAVKPEEVNKAYLSNKVKDDNRKIIHYMQPHAPYLSFDYGGSRKSLRRKKLRSEGKLGKDTKYKGVSHFLRRHVTAIAVKVMGRQNVWRLKEKLGIGPGGPFEAVWRKGGIGGLQYYYEDNLRKVMESASRLMNELEGKTVITADHGEALGEAGIIGHRPEQYIPLLFEVPWLVIEKPGKSKTAERKAERERVRSKARKIKESGRL